MTSDLSGKGPFANTGAGTDGEPLTLRRWLRRLHETGRLFIARPGVGLKFELAAVAKRLDGSQATFFPGPGGHAIPVVSGLVSRRSWIAEALGVTESEVLRRFREASENPLAWSEVMAGTAPCQQVVHRDVDMRKDLPIPTHSEHDSGPYITAGVVIARNPVTGVQNVSINRIQIHAKDRMAVLLLPRHLHAFFADAESRGEALPVAVVIGVEPAVLLASQAITPIDHDELEIAGALRGGALPVVKCLTSGIRVPAHAEIVIEGHLLPGVREPEGPFGEFPKYYSAQEKREVIQVDLLTHRYEPIYHTIIPSEMEHLLLGAIPREATLLSHLQKSFPNVLDVHLSVGGVCRYHLHVKLRKHHEGEPKNVILGALSSHYDIKRVVVVDEDVDVHDPQQVEWAIATRFQADRDLVVVAGAQGSVLDPSTTKAHAGVEGRIPRQLQGLSAKMGLDATRPLVYGEHVFTKVVIPGSDAIDIEAYAAHGDVSAVARMLEIDS